MQQKLFDFLKKELIGPNPIVPYVQENGEEILTSEPPRIRYTAGILYPREFPADDGELFDGDSSDNHNETELSVEVDSGSSEKSRDHSISENLEAEANDEVVSLANAYLPSAIGVSCFLSVPSSGLIVNIRAGRYKNQDFTMPDKEGNPFIRKAFYRESLDTQIKITPSDIPDSKNRKTHFQIKKNGEDTGLEAIIVYRTFMQSKEDHIYTFSLVNTRRTDKPLGDNENCFFQVGFDLEAQDGSPCFRQYPEVDFSGIQDEDIKSNNLLFQHKKMFAVGHGCSPVWEDENKTTAKKISIEIIPSYELKPILPNRPANITLNMYDMSDYGQQKLLMESLNSLCNEYEKWIIEQESKLEEENKPEYKETGKQHIANCRSCLVRMREGVKLIEDKTIVRKAFQLMNRAMLLQQIHFGLDLRKWRFNPDNSMQLEDVPFKEPDIKDPTTWPGWSEGKSKYGSWHPFQIAFILMNLKSMFDPECDERSMVDLIWFPTGGGKTEAYMGLSAYTIFLKRLKDPDNDGTTVLMRYTLRLLTAQQFQRASSMICACESIRKENEKELGKNRITIGLWVGQDLTPNNRTDAIKKLQKITQGRTTENPFLIYKCPWCGAQIGPIKNGYRVVTPGYEHVLNPSRVIFKCKNEQCLFSSRDFCLPLLVVDEDIYEAPPALIIGTVDKFAMLVWQPDKMRSIFGFRNQSRVPPPELIIQDELHLISGPLGSMVGLYETLVDELCTDNINGKTIKAKIVASTATISRAKEQVNALYDRGITNVTIFPPQAIRSGDSFFAVENTHVKGRLYVGIHASGYTHATAHVRVMAALLQGVNSMGIDDAEKNYYWTILDYFNSLRELGHAATRVEADVKEYLESIMWKRMGLFAEDRRHEKRFIYRHEELTSRVESSEITRILADLEINYPKQTDDPIDICLATNMISVGVDVPRLSLMTVTGQPKTTSEYIQATSRVGRSAQGPGIVVVIYNPNKPRDRSHYERFFSYHSTLYKHVEPTSVTPFSIPCCERALHAILIGLVRFFGTDHNREKAYPLPSRELFDKIRKIVEKRVNTVDPAESSRVMKILDERISSWTRLGPGKYSDYTSPFEDTLMYSSNSSSPDESLKEKLWLTPTSMRNVDHSCVARVIGNYGEDF